MNLKVKALSPKIGKEIPAPFYASAGAAAMDLHPHRHRHCPALRPVCGPGLCPQRPGHQARRGPR